MTAKQDILDLIQGFPNIFTFDEAICRAKQALHGPTFSGTEEAWK